MKMVLVFKTSVRTEGDIALLKPNLNFLLYDCKWNFDLTDCDKILRIEAKNDEVNEITTAVDSLLSFKGFICEELSD
jgi:hypothetical protein